MRVLALLLAALVLAGCTDTLRERQNQLTGSGDLALDYIGAKYPKVLVEIDAVAGSAPNPAALGDFERVIEDLLGKPVAVEVSTEVQGRGGTHGYTLAEINDLEEMHRDRFTGGDTAVLYMLYLDGHYAKKGVIGVAYHGSSVALFKGTVRENSREDGQVLPTPSTVTLPREKFVERAVMIHEFGHNLGLVNNGIQMVRPHEQTQDPNPDTAGNEGEKHSRNRESVMYWAVETAQITNVFTSGEDIPWRFDADDKADVAAARSAS